MYSYGMILTGYNEKSFLLHTQFITLDQIFSGWTLAIICLNKVLKSKFGLLFKHQIIQPGAWQNYRGTYSFSSSG